MADSDLVKENIRLRRDEADSLKFLCEQTEASNDSEVLRQSLRNFQQLLDDRDEKRAFVVHRQNGDIIHVGPEMFSDPVDATGVDDMDRRSMILHKRSRERILNLRDKLKAADISAVARIAIRFYHFIVKESLQGARFYVEDKLGGRTEFRFGPVTAPGFDSAARETGDSGPAPSRKRSVSERPKIAVGTRP